MLLIVLLAVPTSVAQGPPTDDGSSASVRPQGYDDGSLEVGVEWVEDYSSLSGYGNLPATQPDAVGLANRLVNSCSQPWISRFKYGNGSAWEQDFKGSSKPGGGKDYAYADNVDLAYFAGHGSSTRFVFGSTVDDHYLHYSDCRLDWGDKDMEWIGIAACNVLADSHRADWSWCMDGLHLIMSFVTTMADVPHGDKFAWYLCRGYNMTQAWFKAADALQPSGKKARVLAEEYHHFFDKYYNHNSSDWNNYSNYWWWDHTVGSEPARQVDIQQLDGVMPVFQTPPLSLAEAGEQWQGLSTAFGVTSTLMSSDDPCVQQDEEIWLSQDGQLEMDPSSGLYAFTDQDSLWGNGSAVGAQAGPTIRLSQEDVKDIADAFLTVNGLMPADAQQYEVAADTMSAAVVTPTRVAALSVSPTEQISQTDTTVWQVIYSRIISYTLHSEAGVAQEPVEFSVMGPGAKLKVYVEPEVPLGLSDVQAQAQAVIGGMGGWRAVGTDGQMTVQQTVDILDYAQIEKLLEQLEPMVALDYVPVLYSSRQVLTYTVGYYELALGAGQDQLIPTYVLELDYTLEDTQEVVSSTVYIPANETYMAPYAAFTPTQEIPSILAVGEELVFQATDASQPLSNLGYDSSLNFALGTGDPDSYLYNWYCSTSSDDNKIGAGPVLTYTVGLCGEPHTGAPLHAQTIILEVTDSSSPRPPSTSYATTALLVARPVYLPMVVSSQ
jgi:hypothetical protein